MAAQNTTDHAADLHRGHGDHQRSQGETVCRTDRFVLQVFGCKIRMEVGRMKQYMISSHYCKETGFKWSMMERLLHSNRADEFSFRSGSGKTSPYYIIVPTFEKMLERGEFKEILEG